MAACSSGHSVPTAPLHPCNLAAGMATAVTTSPIRCQMPAHASQCNVDCMKNSRWSPNCVTAVTGRMAVFLEQGPKDLRGFEGGNAFRPPNSKMGL